MDEDKKCPDCGHKMEYVGTPDGSGGYLHCWVCWDRERIADKL
jgi:hypothetical protein